MSTDNPPLEPGEQFYGKNNEAEAEPIKPTEIADVAKQEDQEPGQEVENLGDPKELETDAKADDDNSAEGLDATGDDENIQYLELDGKEYDLNEVRKWQSGHMMQSDYTKKTTVLADDRKAFEAERDSSRENLLKSQSEVSGMRDTLEVLVIEDEAVDWVELKENDPEEYIVQKEKADERKAALEKVKADRSTPTDDPAFIQSEQVKLFAANPEWTDKDNIITEQYEKDTALIADYAAGAGFTQDEFSRLTSAHHHVTLLKAAKYDQLQAKGRKIKETREKVPLVTKPKATKTGQQSKSMEEVFYGTNG